MNLQDFRQREENFTRRYVYDDTVVVAADLDVENAEVDVLDDTVIVVTDDDQFDLEVSSPPTTAFIRNGVLTIEMEANE